MKGIELLNNPFLNKGTAFTNEERKQLGLEGLLPVNVRTLEQQAEQRYEQFKAKQTDFEKRLFLMAIFNRNRTLFYKLTSEHLVEFMPIIYDPVIAQSIEQYNENFSRPQDAVFLSVDRQDQIEQELRNVANGRDIRLIVVTDAEGILGIGDWGVDGVDIAIGKLIVYTAAAGINPSQVLPVSLDVGTNNEQLLKDDLYLGNRHKRVDDETYYAFVDKFVSAVRKEYPNALLHWEDFGRGHAKNILDKYEDTLPTFNDDIQGTGIVTLAGVLGALNISKVDYTNQTFLVYGGGTAGMGITNILKDELIKQGVSEEKANQHFYIMDKQGLLFDDMDDLTEAQQVFAKNRNEFSNTVNWKNLKEVIENIKPTVLIGTSTQTGAFTEDAVKEMLKHTERPMIFPLSNPTKLAEATAQDLLKWTNGKALIGTGIPYNDIEYNGVNYSIGQANNALMYPGLGLGLIASKAKKVNQQILSAASHALGGMVNPDEPGAAVLPPVEKIHQCSRAIAKAVAQSVIDQGLNAETIDDIDKAIEAEIWYPEYKSYI
ncbi:TPA: malolactic enzyme [Staphylococcus aureus]|uniref:malolactic enzyme n=1 Tax=Staphylococcus aureus TaxID=1280 RepID=UPI000623F732|nr:malolactic enzyme [Staphylococcus aureus]CZQ72867.1 malolactic protein [Staphylococcus aureus]HDK3430585.1 NAD-dependent malic enzyme [Staphylococcus aureus]HDK3577491.1 NAD-dependent malic enzyme [Staphylococcus aureus]HDK3583034.1 NAD-dependent malic enzyme [Staphylococcus aureus]HDK3585766.1 NAD-dependent malic enzyme [Staphylococcus aureus]